MGFYQEYIVMAGVEDWTLEHREFTADCINDEFVEAVEDRLGMGHRAWDMLDPKEIIAAVLNLARVEEDDDATPEPPQEDHDIRFPLPQGYLDWETEKRQAWAWCEIIRWSHGNGLLDFAGHGYNAPESIAAWIQHLKAKAWSK